MELRDNKLGYMPMGRLLVGMSLPLMTSMLVQALYNIVDAIYVSQLSEKALTATTLAFPMQMLMMAFAVGTGVGTNSLTARKLGERRYDEANSVASHGYFLSVCSAALFALAGVFLTESFVALFTDDAELIALCADYLGVCLTFGVGVFVATMGERLLQATGKANLSMVTQAAGAITNIIFDPILIFGRAGFPALGIKGAAIATVAGQFVSCALALLFNKFKNRELKITVRGFKPDAGIIKSIYVVGFPAIVMQAIASFMSICMNKILILFSTTAVAVFGIYFKLQSFVFMPVFGLTQGLTPIVAFNYGAGNSERVKRAAKLAAIMALSVMLFGTAVFELMPGRLLMLFNASDELMAIGETALRIIGVVFPFAALSIVMSSTLQGLGTGIYSLISSFARNMLLLLPSAYFLAKYLGLDSVWFSFWVSEMGSMVLMTFMFAGAFKKKMALIGAN